MPSSPSGWCALTPREWNPIRRRSLMGLFGGVRITSRRRSCLANFDKKEKKNRDPRRSLAGIYFRAPDLVGHNYPGPSLRPQFETPPPIPRMIPVRVLACAGRTDQVMPSGRRILCPMLALGLPNIEMHIYGNAATPARLADTAAV